jgi:glycosyltransferase involved in cell wall biosynthesis
VEKGYDGTKMIVISNGYNLQQFDGDPTVRKRVRTELGIEDKHVVVGTIGRFDPLKDYANFVKSAGMLASKIEGVRFLMVGRGIDSENKLLDSWIANSGIAHQFSLIGERSNIPECLTAMDIFCLSSSGEGFPNVVCEAIAMGVPCVVTDVGDAAQIVSDTGIVVVPGNAEALAEALEKMVGMGAGERSRLGELARRRIEEHYSIEKAASQFEGLYGQLAEKLPDGSRRVAVTN